MRVGVFVIACLALVAGSPAPAPAEYSESAAVQVIEETESFLAHPHYLDNDEIGALFGQLAKDYPQLAQAYKVGRSLQGRPLHALALNAPPANDKSGDLLRPMVKLVANIRGDETLGRQIVLYMAEYLASSYETDDQVQRLLNTTEIHFLPSCNPDGFALAQINP
ncbi:GL20386 [Drosophila persimilis]|uniref:GL20386 n=1 Tax=Drosophila persimilis TaxID=7234 RepID=B4GY06_DROPE|nr:GL20386 [Drosophila persimilis]